jgi:protein phosphatase
MSPSGALRPDFHGESDPGLVRPANEDQFLIAELSQSMVVHGTTLAIEEETSLRGGRPGFLFLVADGMGGAPAGERASLLAVQGVVRSVLAAMPDFHRLEDREEDFEKELQSLLEKCQLAVAADVRENPSREGMGTTLTMAYVLWPRLYVVHVGDARAYLHHGGRLEQITTDHTVQPPAPNVEGARAQKVLWNVIGGEHPEVWPDVYKATLEPGDLLLLATDGLHREVPDPSIAKILRSSRDARDACRSLVEAATRAGGHDNVTVVVARWEPPGSAASKATARAELRVEKEEGHP